MGKKHTTTVKSGMAKMSLPNQLKLVSDYNKLVTEFNQYLAEEKDRLNDARMMAKETTMQMVLIALGRMGFREKRYAQLKKINEEVWKDYYELLLEDKKIDEDLWNLDDKINKELKLYMGKEYDSNGNV